MRLKITRRLSGSIDGLQLSHFESGESYEVGTSIGSYLLAIGAAEPVLDDTPAPVVSVGTRRADAQRRASLTQPPSIATDTSARKR